MKTIPLDDLLQLDQPTILDVREVDEILEEGKIPHALVCPLSTLQQGYSTLDPSLQYYVICYSGARSQMASMFLESKGYHCVCVLGGMADYQGERNYEV